MRLRKLINAFIDYLTDDKYRFLMNTTFGLYNNMSDEDYLKRRFKLEMGTGLDLDNPKTFNEKLQWLKIHNHDPRLTTFVDKYLVRDYINSLFGSELLIPLLGVWDNPSQIDFDALPDQFVLKCNHNSGKGMVICKDKSKLNIKHTVAKLSSGLKENYYIGNREWPYKNVKRKIICEKYMTDESGDELKDYKIHCFNGEPKIILMCSGRFSPEGLRENFYDCEWNLLPLRRPAHENTSETFDAPVNLASMLSMSRIIAKGYPFMRVDFYEINQKPYFGEITLYPASGFSPFEPEIWDKTLGDWIHLS